MIKSSLPDQFVERSLRTARQRLSRQLRQLRNAEIRYVDAVKNRRKREALLSELVYDHYRRLETYVSVLDEASLTDQDGNVFDRSFCTAQCNLSQEFVEIAWAKKELSEARHLERRREQRRDALRQRYFEMVENYSRDFEALGMTAGEVAAHLGDLVPARFSEALAHDRRASA